MHRVVECPVCNNREFKPKLICQDHIVSHETFPIEECTSCGLLLTNPQPDPADLQKYYLSDNYTSHKKDARSFLDYIYKLARVLTLRDKHRLIHQYTTKQKLTILDFGCGTGDFLKKCKEKGDEIFGVEPSSIARAIASQKTAAKIKSSISDLNGSVDVITAWHVIEHVPDLTVTIKNLTAKLGKNGTMFIAVPNHESYDAAFYNEFWAGYDVPRHLWHFSKSNMEHLLQKANCKLIATLPMKLDSYYVSLLSEKHRSGKTTVRGFFMAIKNGMVSNLRAGKTTNHSSLIYIAQKK
jgi:2-polyprenyl-3-methyl-5-hydroxy-6-metoxy-1,4-benzoquinol methylase